MAIVTKQDIIDTLKEMKLSELNELVKLIEETFDVVASAGFAMAPEAASSASPTEVAVVLTAVGQQKVQVIKVVKELTGLGLMDAKKLVDGAVPVTLKENVKVEDAEAMKAQLLEVGASVDLK